MNRVVNKIMTATLLLIAVFAFTFVDAFFWKSDSNENKASAKNQALLDENIVEITSQDASFKTLTTALQAADLSAVLEGPGPFTVFAPTDEAFDQLGQEKLNELLKPENKEKLRAVLLYHVVPGKMLAGDLKTMTVPTANGEDIKITVNGSKVTVGDAEVINADIVGKNGVIHSINAVMIPEESK